MSKKAGFKLPGGFIILIIGALILVGTGGKILELLKNPIMLMIVVVVVIAIAGGKR